MERREGRKVKRRGGDGEIGRWLEREERGGEGYKTVLRANKQWGVGHFQLAPEVAVLS